jgi:thioredoxin 1
MGSFLHVDESNFEQEVLNSATPVLVEFGAEWCGPCKRLEPELEHLATTWGNKVRLARLDVDESSNLTMHYQVMAVPTIILFVDGDAAQRLTGYQPRERVVEKVEPYLK